MPNIISEVKHCPHCNKLVRTNIEWKEEKDKTDIKIIKIELYKHVG